MTKEQAIKIIRRYECNSEHYEACEIAIKALEQSSYNSIKTELKPCEDAISRQAALDAIDVKAWEFCDYLISKNRNDEQKPVSHFADTLRECVREELPSVNPQPSGDLISRQSAIFLASDLKQDLPDDERIADMVMAHNEGVSEYQTQLSLLPSVTPQPKTGHWIEKDGFDGDVYYDCSECGESWTTIEGTPWDNEFKYCPSCGAWMVEPQKSEE